MQLLTLALIVQGDDILLGHKKRGEIGTNTLNGPGGKLEPNETLVECVIRETFEELRVTLFPDALEHVAVITFHVHGSPNSEMHVYRTEKWTGALQETEDMIPEWHPINKLPLGRMLEGDRAWFRRAAQGECFRANVYYRSRAEGFEGIEFLPYE